MKPDLAGAYDKPAVHTASHSRLMDWLILAKVRVNALVVATTAGGYYMASGEGIDLLALAVTCAATALVASGAAAFNQVSEHDLDRLMNRTRHRPIADRRMSPGEGLAVSAALALTGLALLWMFTNPVATLVALATLVSYAVIYTPLKRHTSLATVIGAVPGALPPLIGWAAVTGSVAGPKPWALFLIGFFWQLPHFLAIAWIYREDYARAGMKMLSVVDKEGAFTGRQTLLWAAALLPFSQLPFLFGMTTAIYAIGAIVLGLAQIVVAFEFARHRSIANARRLFLASILYLPLLWALMVVARA